MAHDSASKKGGWITMPFILATLASLSLAYGGLLSGLEVYLIQEFNIKRITAAKISNVFNGFICILPIAAAVLADSFLGCFSVISISSFISLLGMLLLSLTAASSKLRPPPCKNSGGLCSDPTAIQLTVLYIGLGLASLGMAGTRVTLGPLGAHQFNKVSHQTTFFNWYIFTMYICTVISSTAIVYVQDHVSWSWGFGICFASNAFGLALFLAGARFYHHQIPQGSPFAGLARVLVAAIRKRRSVTVLSHNPADYCQEPESAATDIHTPTSFFKFLNRAAMKTEGDCAGTCTVSEVEDLKSLIKMLPIWLSALMVSIPLVIQLSMGILQVLTMDRRIGNSFTIPAASVGVFLFLSTCITILFIDRVLVPVWNKAAPRHPITPLQRVGIGHFLDVLSMAALALVEVKRLKTVKMYGLQDRANSVVPISVFWLIPSLALAGMGEAFHFPGHTAFYYQEFPKQLKSTSAAIISLSIGIAFYAGNALIDAVRRSTDWLPDNINRGRLDNLYWLVTILGGLNFCYFLICASLYKYRNED